MELLLDKKYKNSKWEEAMQRTKREEHTAASKMFDGLEENKENKALIIAISIFEHCFIKIKTRQKRRNQNKIDFYA